MVERVHSVIRFDGPALSGHSMDVAHLAPALLSLSEVVKAANTFANGDRAGVKVYVNANLEQKCFELNLELALTIWEQAKLLITDERIVAAKEIAEWIGLVGGAAGGVGWGLFKFIKHIRGRKIESVTVLKMKDGNSVIEVRVEGADEPIIISKAVYELYADKNIRRKTLDVLAPLRETGYDSLKFYDGDTVFTEFSSDEIPEPGGSDLPEVIPQNLQKSNIRTGVRIRKAVYEGTSKWTLVYKRAIDASIDDLDWLNTFQSGAVNAPPGSSLDVDLEESYIMNENSEIIGEATYRVVKVHDVLLPPEQKTLRFREGDALSDE
ncbi:hypothetical protein [Rhodospira trueperi]|uniref:Uncharacterized protein n=1 Tax=Rhodospira trueperi TaxID=69960 RepID=A0A1G7AAC8_9PROT|nr:hypothetical protein [Rhodospira trueperi]SDE11844.1 hypothetical protein SAMN05421720_103248 [Rhodospira trueperi]